jgi:DNA-binding response OmpR family regulator
MGERAGQLIYIVEDHQLIREGVGQYLRLSGYTVRLFGDLASLEAALAAQQPDLLIQDVMLPDGDGFAFVKELKEKSDFPVIFMTARIEESDRILGFELGADDYISKPFSPKELVLRVQAVLRRYSEKEGRPSDGLLHVQDHTMRFDEKNHSLHVNDEEVFLTAAEWRILAHLINKADELVSRSEILKECFDYSAESYERVVDTHIKNIRAKLGDGPWIETIRGWGYRFIGHGTP